MAMAKYDLTPRIAPNLDRHLVLPLLEFTQERELYPNDQILKAKIELLNNTNMVDYAMDIHKSLYHTEDVPQDMVDRRIEVVARLTSLEEAAAPLVTFLENPSAVQELRADKQYNLQMLNDRYQIGPEQIEALYQYAKFQFECGNYSGAADYLYQYRALCTNAERSLSALWRKLAAEILMQDWEIALEELNRLKEIIDSKNFASSLNQVQSRIRLMHWSLFIFFNHDNWRTQIIDLFNQDKYLNAIQTNAPHLLRYLATAFIVNKKRRPQFKEFIKVIQQEQHAFADPIIEFLACVYVNFDFDGAQNKMKECEDVILNDPFLGKRVEESNYTVVPLKDEFLENARLFIFDMDFSESAPRPPSPPKQQQPPQEAPHSSPKKKPTSSKSKSERVHVSRRHLSKIKSGVEKLTSLAEELKGQIPSIDDIRSMATNLAYLQEAVYDHFMFHDRFQAEIEEIDFHTADNFRNLIQDVNKFQRCVTENVEKFATDNAVEIHGLQQKLKEKDDQIRELQQTITTLKLEKQRQAETLALAHTINDTVTKLEFNISAQVTKDVMAALSSQFALSGAGMKIASSYQGGEELTAEEIAILEKGKMERELRVAEAEKQKAKEIADKLAVDLAAEQAAKEAAEVAVKEAVERELAEKLKNDAKPKSPQGPFGSDDEGETTIGLSDDEENEQTVEEVAQAVAKKELEDKIFQAWDIFLSENPNEDTENFVYCDGAAIIYKDMSTPQENIIEIPQPTAGRQLRDDHFVPHQSYLVPASSSQQIDLQLNPNAYFFDIWSPSQQGLSKKKVDREMNSKNAAFYKKYQQLRSNIWSADKITYLEKVEQRSFRSQPWFKFYVRRGDQSFMISDADFIDVNPNDLLILWELLNRTKSYNNTRQLAQIRIQNFLDMYIYDIFRHDAEIGPILTGDNWLNLSPKLSFQGIEAAELGARKLPELGFVYRAADGKKFLRARQVYKFSSRFLHAILKTITERPKGDEEALRLVADKIRWWLLVREWAITADRTLHPVQE